MNKPWLDRVAAELVRQGVPRRARSRLLLELRDHLDDISLEGFDMDVGSKLDARLGEPGEVAAVAVAEYRRAGWVRRHPLLVFGLVPLPLAVLGVIGYALAFTLVVSAVEVVVDDLPRPAALALGYVLVYTLPYLPSVLAAGLLGRLAARHHVSRMWLVAAVAQVALFAGSLVARIVWIDTGEPMGILGLTAPGVTEPDAVFHPLTRAQLPQVLAPVGVAWAVWSRRAGDVSPLSDPARAG